jgi:tetratricopeptide (TPR) repeat protein
MMAYYHGEPGRNKWTRLEKIGIPVNLMGAIVLLFFLFYGKDLGAIQKSVMLEDEEGNKIERVIPKAEFRRRIALFFFENESLDTTTNWLQYAVPEMLRFDLAQDLFFNVITGYDFFDQMEKDEYPTGIGLPLILQKRISQNSHMQYFVTGSLNKQNDAFSVSISIFMTQTTRMISEETFTGDDIFKILDEMTLFVKRSLGLPQEYIEDVEDLPITEITSTSINALKYYIASKDASLIERNYRKETQYLEQAVKEDTTFALAYYRLRNLYIVVDPIKSNPNWKMLMKYLYKLPKRHQFRAKQGYYKVIKNDPSKIIAIAQMWVELYPGDTEACENLGRIYLENNQPNDAISVYHRLLEIDPEEYDILREIGILYKNKGDYNQSLFFLEKYAKQFPENSDLLNEIRDLHMTFGNYNQAKSYVNKALILNPVRVSSLVKLADIDVRLGNFNEALDQYLSAINLCKTSQEKATVYKSLKEYYRIRGQLGKAFKYDGLYYSERQKYKDEFNFIAQRASEDFHIYIHSGNEDVAEDVIKSVETNIPPPLNGLASFFSLDVKIELKDVESSDKELTRAKKFVEDIKNLPGVSHEFLGGEVFYRQGRVYEIKDMFNEAVSSYQKALDLVPTYWICNLYIGRCLRKSGNLSKAKQYVQKFLNIEPFNPEANLETALVYWEMGKKEKALEHLHRVLIVWKEADSDYEPAKAARARLAVWES